MQSFTLHSQIVNQGLGQIAGDDKGNETAEAVLLRRENKDTASNDMIKNLLDSAYSIAETIEEFIESKVTVTSDIFAKARQNDELQKIIAFTQFISQNKMAYEVTPVLISKLDIDDNSKNMLLQLLSQQKEQDNGAGQEIEMLKLENQQLRANQEAHVAAAQINRESMMSSKMIDARIKEEELKLKWAELGMKENGERIKLGLEAEKINNELEARLADIKIKEFNAGLMYARQP